MKASERAAAAAKSEAAAPTNGSDMAMILTREDILSAPDLQQETVAVPEWGGSVFVRGLDGMQRDSFERSMVDIKGKDSVVNYANFRGKMVARSVVDENGKRVFKDSDAENLGKKSGKALGRVFDVAQRLSGMSDEDVEELTAALKDDPSADSGSASQ